MIAGKLKFDGFHGDCFHDWRLRFVIVQLDHNRLLAIFVEPLHYLIEPAIMVGTTK